MTQPRDVWVATQGELGQGGAVIGVYDDYATGRKAVEKQMDDTAAKWNASLYRGICEDLPYRWVDNGCDWINLIKHSSVPTPEKLNTFVITRTQTLTVRRSVHDHTELKYLFDLADTANDDAWETVQGYTVGDEGDL